MGCSRGEDMAGSLHYNVQAIINMKRYIAHEYRS